MSPIGKRSPGQPREVGPCFQQCLIIKGKALKPTSESERENERSEESKESEEMRDMRDEIEVLKRTLGEQKLRAQRDALAAEVERGAGGGRRRETAARDSTSSTPMPASGLGAQSGMSQLSSSRPNLTQTRPPKFDNIEAHFRMAQ